MKNLGEIVFSSTKRFSDRVAIEIDNEKYSYRDLYCLARPLVSVFKKLDEDVIGIFANRSVLTYVAIYACALSGKTYMPLPVNADASRLNHMLTLSKANVVLTCNNQSLDSKQLKVSKILNLDDIIKNHASLLYKAINFAEENELIPHNENAYIMFTSGSTGKPKAVRVGQSQVIHYLTAIRSLYQPTEHDRFSQVIELTFDLSVHDIFVCWASGAALMVFNGQNYLQLSRYIENQKPTFWLSVPSTGIALDRLKLLQHNKFNSLKVVLFCGEPLPFYLAQAWKNASPQAEISNIYGPTEATIAFTTHKLSEAHDQQCHKVVPIGKPLDGLHTKINSPDGSECSPGETGELLLGGPQVVNGYFNQPDKTQEKFIFTGDQTWYRTGDLAYQDSNGVIHFKGRIDDQLQIQGQRIEKLELETMFREALKTSDIALITSPVTEEGIVLGIALVYLRSEQYPDNQSIRQSCLKQFQAPLIPTAYHALDQFPLNTSGKVDYPKLVREFQKIEKLALKVVEVEND